MTSILVPDSVRRPAGSRRGRGPAVAAVCVVLAAAFGAAPVLAQAPASPPPAPPPQTAGAPAPVVRPPSGPPPAAAPRTPSRAGAAVQPSATPLQPPPGRAAGPPRPSASPAAAPDTQPANAVARCRDGTFIVAPATASACATHRGVGVTFPQRPPPPQPSARPRPAARVAAAPATPPAGATMQCRDGTWLTGTPAAERCAANGGVAVILPAARPTPPRPLPHRP